MRASPFRPSSPNLRMTSRCNAKDPVVNVQISRVEAKRADTTAEPVLYESAQKIYPRAVHGTFRRIKWALLCITLGIYYFTPFLRWDRGPGAPDQAVLIDLGNRRAYFFFIEIWPQEVYYITGLLVIASLALFLMNALAGRIWCGYLCPQTVWTDLYLLVERWTEGDRRERIALDARPWSVEKAARKGAKHFAWLMIAWWTGGAWVLYFADAPTLVRSLANGTAPVAVYGWIGLLTFTTYALAGFMREQVCLYMCPWPRIQAALTDEDALNVSYRYDRGEPRMPVKRGAIAKREGKPAGDCVDCRQCVNSCPTGVDIRDGAQLGCIQCGLCIDACDEVMLKINRPTGLIAYDTEANIRRRLEGVVPVYHLVRPRTILYAALIAVIGCVMLYTLSTRATLGLDVIHDRNPLFVRLSNDGIRNGFTLRLINKRPQARDLLITAVDLPPQTKLQVIGGADWTSEPLKVSVPADTTRELRVLAVVPASSLKGPTTAFGFRVFDPKTQEERVSKDFFKAPDASAAAARKE